MTRAKGIDISHHQPPGSIDWEAAAREIDFVYIRATYGARRDKHFAEHVEAARNAGLKVGAYHFLRQPRDMRAASERRADIPVQSQIQAFGEALEAVGYGYGDLPPAIDIEDNLQWDGPLDGEQYRTGARAMADWCLERYGETVAYTSQRDWRRMGNPDWIRHPDVHLWVAHWTDAAEPATPMGLPWDIWQWRVTPAPSWFRGERLDQNVFRGPAEDLPVMSPAGPAPETEVPPEHKTDPVPASPSASLDDLMDLILDTKQSVDGLVQIVTSRTDDILQFREHVDEQFELLSKELGELRTLSTKRDANVTSRLADHESRIADLEKRMRDGGCDG